MTPQTKIRGFRLDDTLVNRIDWFRDKLNKEVPGATFTRADAVRILLTQALEAEEAQEAQEAEQEKE